MLTFQSQNASQTDYRLIPSSRELDRVTNLKRPIIFTYLRHGRVRGGLESSPEKTLNPCPLIKQMTEKITPSVLTPPDGT